MTFNLTSRFSEGGRGEEAERPGVGKQIRVGSLLATRLSPQPLLAGLRLALGLLVKVISSFTQ